jgi:DNA-binding NarL/FixJ family response regulator
MSGHSEEVTPEGALALGVTALLAKPISIEELLTAVRDALDSTAGGGDGVPGPKRR